MSGRSDLATRLLVQAMMSEATKRRIKKKKADGVCIRKGCTSKAKPGCRDNCGYCYQCFDNERRLQGDAADRRAFDDREVALGNVSPARRGRRRSKKNPYQTSVA